MILVKYLLTVIFTISLFTGCTAIKQEKLEEVFHTNSAYGVKKDYQEISNFLIKLKEKLDKRNPKAYDKTKAAQIYTDIKNLTNTLDLSFNGNPINSYQGYLQIAFSKDNIKNRNDFLILGLYKMFYEAYSIGKSYKLTAFSYDKSMVQRAYQNLQVIAWKVKMDKDLNKNYLFLTWQNNWQIELEKKIAKGENPSWKDLQNLKYIKDGKETMFSASNSSFEVLFNLMKYRTGLSLKRLGVEPADLSLAAIKGLFLFL